MILLSRSKTQRKLLTYAFAHTEQNYYVREVAGFIKEDPGNVSRELAKLEKEGIVLSLRRGSIKLFSLNKQYPLFKELKQILTKHALLKKAKAGMQQLEMEF